MKEELKKLLERQDNQFITVFVDDKEFGSYCTKNHEDLERLYEDMIRHNKNLTEIRIESIEKANDVKEETLSNMVECLKNKLKDAESDYCSAVVKKQAFIIKQKSFKRKLGELEAFVANFNKNTDCDDKLELSSINDVDYLIVFIIVIKINITHV